MTLSELHFALAKLRLRLLFRGHAANNVRITRIGDAEGCDAEIFPARRAELNVVTGVVVHAGLRQHSVVFYLALS